MEEKWLPIPMYEGYYEISSTGKIKSLTRTIIRSDGKKLPINGKELKQYIGKDGYYKVILSKDGIVTNFPVHRLVALTFIPNPNNLPIVNHKDENKLNNNVDNLEWCTYEYNTNYGTCKERISQTMSQVKEHPVIMCDKITHEPIKEFSSIKVAAKELGSPNSYSCIWRVIKGERKSALNYWWKYKN